MREHVEDHILVSEDGEVRLLNIEYLLVKIKLDLTQRLELFLVIRVLLMDENIALLSEWKWSLLLFLHWLSSWCLALWVTWRDCSRWLLSSARGIPASLVGLNNAQEGIVRHFQAWALTHESELIG